MIENQVIFISGGAGLLGSSFCRKIAQHGGHPVVGETNVDAAKKLVESLHEDFPACRAEALYVDINDKDSIQKILSGIHNKYGRIDAIVNSAYPRNSCYGRDFFDVAYTDFCENINLNLGGYFLMSQQFAAYFANQGKGNIINIASIYGIMAPRFEIYENNNLSMPVEYAVIKAAIIHLTRFMAKRFKGLNIRVNAISPGGILKDQPREFLKKYNAFGCQKGMLDASDVDGALLFLLSDDSSFITGQNLVVDDGWSR